LLTTGIVLSGAAWTALWASRAFTNVQGTIARTGLVQRRAAEVWMSDVSPKGKKVMSVYRELVDMKGEEDGPAVQRVMGELDTEQKAMLKALIQAKSGMQDRPITNTNPEVGDTLKRLYEKYKMIMDDDTKATAWRLRMEMNMLQDVQVMIEQDQMKMADAEAAKDNTDEAAAEKAWGYFKAKFPQAVINEAYMGTPTRENDVKYRFRRFKESLEISDEIALEIVAQDATPMVVDPSFIRRTWKAMVGCIGKEEALNDIVRKHPGAIIVQAHNVEAKIQQIKMGASVIGAFADLGKMFR